MKHKIFRYIKISLLVITGLIPLFLLWLMNGNTILTIMREDWFTEKSHECLTDNCLDTFGSFLTGPDKEYYIIPYILNKIEYEDPYHFDFYFDLSGHKSEITIKDYKVEVMNKDKLIMKDEGTEKDLRDREGSYSIRIEGIPFDADKYDTITAYVEYTLVQDGVETIHKEKLVYTMEVLENIGFYFWWAAMSV